MKPYYFHFTIREYSKEAKRAVSKINKLASKHKSFCLSFDENFPEKVLVQSCQTRLKKTSFVLVERTPKIEKQISTFNQLLPKNPVVLVVGIEGEICITVVVND